MTGFLVYLLIGVVVAFALDLLTESLLAQGELKKEEAPEFTLVKIVLLALTWPVVLAAVLMSSYRDDNGKGPDNFAH